MPATIPPPSPPSTPHSNASDRATAHAQDLTLSHLSEEQKKANHIASEKKRRTNIREQYDKLADMTPGMEGHGRSEGRVLEEVVKRGRALKEERRQLIREIEARGGIVDDCWKKF